MKRSLAALIAATLAADPGMGRLRKRGPTEKRFFTRREWLKRKSRMRMAKESRRRNRRK